MRGPAEQDDLAKLWRQIARWLVTDITLRVEIEAHESAEGIELVVEARDEAYKALEIGQARISIRRVDLDPAALADHTGFKSVDIYADPVSNAPGRFSTTFTSTDEGAYIASVEVLGPDDEVIGTAETGWVNEPLADEYQALSPRTDLLASIAAKTKGKIIQWDELDSLSELFDKRSAPITEAWSYPLWHNGWLFIAALTCFLAEWALRRKRGLA